LWTHKANHVVAQSAVTIEAIAAVSAAQVKAIGCKNGIKEVIPAYAPVRNPKAVPS